ncbi:MAG: hypothetical protein JSS82_01985 [Bacteroidetes bacterium]|nr:hypothetical protein [Bacteroidota bacterium]
MRRITTYRTILTLAILILCVKGIAQQYGNEWIDYNKTYYKFKVGKEGIYRINKNALDAVGVPATVSGGNFILYRNGQEVTVYTSTTGTFGTNDYIEFFGTPNDGSFDRGLFQDPSWQSDPGASLFSDTACYFLTYDNQSNHLRYIQNTDPIPAGPPAAESSCIATSVNHYRDHFLSGRSYSSDDQLFSSQFDVAEGFVYEDGTNLNFISGAYIGAPGITPGPVQFKANILAVNGTTSATPLNFKISINNQLIADSNISLSTIPAAVKTFDVTVPSGICAIDNLLSLAPSLPNASGLNVYGCSYIQIRYPHDFNMNFGDYSSFALPASTNSQYLEFLNFNHGGIGPRLYDLNNRKWYTGNIDTLGKTRFYIEPSLTERSFVLFASASSHINNLQAVMAIHFTNYTSAAQEANYLIVTNKALRDYQGHDYVQDYKDYRSSATGGGYTAGIADVTELYDQFAYGNDIHPLAIKNFLRYAHDKWTMKPVHVFLLGKGLLYNKYSSYLQNISSYPFPIVPTYGNPGSDVDFVNFGTNLTQKMNIARVSVWNGQEIGTYLDKVKAYEAAIKPAVLPSVSTELWKKNALHIAGGSDINLQTVLLNTLNAGAAIIKGIYTGDLVTTVAKNTTSPVDAAGSAFVDSMLNSGVGLLTFHGHASSGNFDFNLNNPEQYHNSPRLPLFTALGCDVAQIYELTNQRTISERYVNAPGGGAIAMLAQDNLGYTNFHSIFIRPWYGSLAYYDYNGTVGSQYAHAYDSTLVAFSILTNAYNFYFTELESMILQGDPAVSVYSTTKPDYHVSDSSISSIPFNINTTLDSFKLKVVCYDLSKALMDTVYVRVEHINPAGAVTTLSNVRITKLFNTDTFYVSVPINRLTDLGLNKYRVTIDPDNLIDEVSENNNQGIFNLFIYSNNLIPIYPQDFGIVGQQGVTLKANTLNAFRVPAAFRMEIDTTELFNSPLKQQTAFTGLTGVVKWKPTLSYKDSTVYYWRAAYDSLVNGNYSWTNSSFIYIPQKSGWNQSHYYQYLKDSFTTLNLNNGRQFNYPLLTNSVIARNAMRSSDLNWPYSGADCDVLFNDIEVQRDGCSPYVGTLQVMVFDSASAQLWVNPPAGQSGAYGRCLSRNVYAFEFPLNTLASRNNIRHFLDSIPNNDYVLLRNFIYAEPSNQYQAAYVDAWKADTSVNGPGQSLYHTIRNMGFDHIDSFNRKRVFILMRKKGSNAFPVYQKFSNDTTDKIELDVNIQTLRYSGTLTSRTVGPAKSWTELRWQTHPSDNFPQNDSSYLRVSGISATGTVTSLFVTRNRDTSIAGISAAQYPNLKLEWNNQDTTTHTAPQLDYWRIYYVPLPEAALNPAAEFSFVDTLQAGQLANFSVAIEELAGQPMDSMLVRYKLIDANGNMHPLGDKKYKKLVGNDTLQATFSFNPSSYPGADVLYVEANPDNNQPEQYHPNNLGYIPFKVDKDQLNPFIDVTFDGVHILDKDIVSARPFIKITLRDENKYLALDDTSLMSMSIRYPSDPLTSRRTLNFDNNIVKFFPAQLNKGKNEATIEYRPDFAEDGIYELFVNGKDKSGNAGGADDYRISFEVVNKPSITNILNYPNPFSTATAFVFTLTGYQIPSQLKIQILTVTGKVVKEITKGELGALHIGRNITEYKWDGKDQYGQTLGNGVYFYRVVSSLNGNNIDHRDSGADKYFKHGYGKMYIMR